MNERERVLAVFNEEKPDITPWYADLAWWYASQKQKGILLKKYEGDEGYLRFHQDVGVGIYLYPPPVWTQEFREGIERIDERKGNTLFTRITTPVGELTATKEDLPDSFTSGYREHFIKTMDDLEIMLYYFQGRIITPESEDFVRIDELWNGWGIPVLLGPCNTSPLQNIINGWAGIETTVELLWDHRSEFEGLIKEFEKCDDQIFEIICESPAQIVVFPENLSGEVTGANLLKKYNIPYLEKRIDQLHEAGKLTLLHNDGTLRASLPLLAETDLDCVESVTPFPVGDLTLNEIIEIAQDKIIIWGCLPGALFSPLYPKDYFENYLKEVIDTFSSHPNFVLASADQVPPDAELSRIASVRRILEDSIS